MSENGIKSMEKGDFCKRLFKTACDKNWSAVVKLMNERESFQDISQRNITDGKTILHYACDELDPHVAKPAVEKIFEEVARLGPEYDELQKFVNQKDLEDQTALDTALKNGHDDIVQILLLNNADVSIKFESKVNRRYHKVLSKFLDDGLYLEDDMFDTKNEYVWTIWCKFSTLTGISTTDNPRETKVLTDVLKIKDFKNFEFFLHPSVIMFVHAKSEKYKYFMWTSFVVHMLWYILTAIYFYGSLQTGLAANSTGNTSTNSTDSKDNGVLDWISSANLFQFTVFPCMFAVMTIKEIGKIVLATTTSKTMYVQQWENWGKLSLIILVFLTGTLGLCFWAKFVGIVLSVILIMKIFTKTDYFGLRLQILIKSFVLLIGYIISFFPILFVFMVVFSSLLLPKDMNPFLRFAVGSTDVLSKVAGELNFNDTFSDENMKDENNLTFLMIMAVIYFVFILVAMLLQNILIGQIVDNMKKITRKATAAHVITRLQAVNSWESLLLGNVGLKCLELFRLKEKVVRQLSVGPQGKQALGKPEGIPDDFRYKAEFVNLPDYVREAMYKSKSLFPNGVNPEDHEDW